MRKISIFILLPIVLVTLLLNGCSGLGSEFDYSFQKNGSEPEVKLFELFDETPAIKSALKNLDPHELNIGLDKLYSPNMPFFIDFQRKFANTFYGYDPVMPQIMSDLSESFSSFYDIYKNDPQLFDDNLSAIRSILSINSGVMSDTTTVLKDLLIHVRDETALFKKDQEFGDFNINVLIDNFDVASDIFGKEDYKNNPAALIRYTLKEAEKSTDIEKSAKDVIDYLEFSPEYKIANPDKSSVENIEKELAQWVAKSYEFPEKEEFLRYLMEDLYPFVKEPIFENIDIPDNIDYNKTPSYITNDEDYKNIVKRARWIIDEEASILSKTPFDLWKKYSDGKNLASSSPNGDNKDSSVLKYLFEGIYNDMDWYDHLEDIELFDYKNNELLKYIEKDVYDQMGAAFSDVSGYESADLHKLLWNGRTFAGIENGVQNVTVKGIFNSDGPVNELSNVKSYDDTIEVNKPFRLQMNDIINGNNDGIYNSSDNNNPLKPINLSYKGENIIESMIKNYYHQLFSSFYCRKDYYYNNIVNKWAMTPEDGKNYFNDSTRNLQNKIGDIVTAIRNIVTMDGQGLWPGDFYTVKVVGKPDVKIEAKESSMLTDLVFLIAAGSGKVDPVNAPAVMTMKDSFRSMGSELYLDLKNVLHSSDRLYRASYYDFPDSAPLYGGGIPYFGNNTAIRTWHSETGAGSIDYGGVARILTDFGYYEGKSSWGIGNWGKPRYWTYTSQHNTPAMETLSPGCFKPRNGTSTASYGVGSFSPSQGDLTGIANSGGEVGTAAWMSSEIALATWEGYGPYTYKGKAPNGSDCKYRNDWYTDWYTVAPAYFKNNHPKGPGLEFGNKEGRYHVYEAIYKENKNSSTGLRRKNGSDYVSLNGTSQVILDCSTREEAMRKNLQWLLKKKKYMFVLPNQGTTYVNNWGLKYGEVIAYTSINANGLIGVAKARQKGPDPSNNGKWVESTVNSSAGSVNVRLPGTGARPAWFFNLALTNDNEENGNSVRIKEVSFDAGDSMIGIELKTWVNVDDCLYGWKSEEFWQGLGSGTMLPKVVYNAIEPLVVLANATYKIKDILGVDSPDAHNANPEMSNFKKYFNRYYPDLDVANTRDIDFPPLPRVYGVRYPYSFDTDGNIKNWQGQVYEGESKGKFDDIIGLICTIVGTIHEDGVITINDGKDIDGIYNAKLAGIVKKYENNGFRKHFDSLIESVAILNESKADINGVMQYNENALTNILVDMEVDPNTGTGTVIPGSRKGMLPSLLGSKFLNFNNITPLKNGVSELFTGVLNKFLNNGNEFFLSKIGSEKLKPYRLSSGINPAIDWDKPMNMLRYLFDDISLEQLERTVDLAKDFLKDDRTRGFIKKTIPALNKYIIIKYAEENNCSRETAIKEIGTISTTESNDKIDDLSNLMQDLDHGKALKYLKDLGLNDIEKLTNFKLDDLSTDELTSPVLKEHFDELNALLNRRLGANLKAGIIDGIYQIQESASFIPPDFKKGEIIFGTGKYVECKDGDPGSFESPESSEEYYRYIDCETYITSYKTDKNELEVLSGGIREIVQFRTDSSEDFSEFCQDYKDPWYKNGNEECPNIYNLHAYDLNIKGLTSGIKDSVNSLGEVDFKIGGEVTNDILKTFGKNDQKKYYRPESIINSLYNWNGSFFESTNIKKGGLEYLKDIILDNLYDNMEIELRDESNDPTAIAKILSLESSDKITVRNMIGKVRETLNENVFKYGFSKNGIAYKEEYKIDESTDSIRHTHILNSIADLISTVINPDNPNLDTYFTGRFFKAWEDFIKVVNISPEHLKSVKKIIGDLLYDDDKVEIFDDKSKVTGFPEWQNNGTWNYDDHNKNGKLDNGEFCEQFDDKNGNGLCDDGFTRIFSGIAKRLPRLLREFSGSYEELIRIGVLAMEDDGIGTYLANNLAVDGRFDSWDMFRDVNSLLNQDIFLEYSHEDTFWWETGTLLDEFSTLLEHHVADGKADVSGSYTILKEIFN